MFLCFFLLFPDGKQKVQKDAEDSSAGDAGHIHAEEVDVAAEGILEVGSATDPQTGFVSLLRLTKTRISRL